MQKVSMLTSHQFVATLKNTGRDSVISKLDHVSAFKLLQVKNFTFMVLSGLANILLKFTLFLEPAHLSRIMMIFTRLLATL